jgi:hypothetical protein
VFWLRELRTPALLVEAAGRFAKEAESLRGQRRLLELALERDATGLASALYEEEQSEREADREYWRPLREELQRLRRAARSR